MDEKKEVRFNPALPDMLAKYNINATEALWPHKGYSKKTGKTTITWIIYHRYCEQIAAKAFILFDKPEVIVNEFIEIDKKFQRFVVVLVTGRMPELRQGGVQYVEEWSFGEATPENNSNPYPFAMAEKRAKDRVILKLAGIHGLVYSDSEIDFETLPNDKPEADEKPKTNGWKKPPKDAKLPTTSKDKKEAEAGDKIFEQAWFEYETLYKSDAPDYWRLDKDKFRAAIIARWKKLPTRKESVAAICDKEKGIQLEDVMVEDAQNG